MDIKLEIKTAEVISCLEREGYSARTLADHERCYDELRKHMACANAPFSMEMAVEWLETRKSSWSWDTYKRYRRALYRLEKHINCGEIRRERHCGNNNFAYHDAEGVSYIKLPDNYKAIYREFYAEISRTHAKQTIDHYVIGCTDFLLFLAESNISEPSEMTIEIPAAYLRRIHGKDCSEDKKSKYAEGIGTLLLYFFNCGHIPRCYSHVMSKLDNEHYIKTLKMAGGKMTNAVFQPSKGLEPQADIFLSAISERRYSVPPEQTQGCIFRSFFIFLELNNMPYSRVATQIWLDLIPKTTTWGQKRTIITRFADYMETGEIYRSTNYVWRQLLIDSLPGWSQNIINDYIDMRQKEDRAPSTLMMIRSSCVRFFLFLDSKGVGSPAAITPTLVKEFHDTDIHATPRAKNAYGVRIRRLLQYMAGENLVPKNLHLAISTQCAESRGIVGIMDDSMVSAVYDYRAKATSPLELRDVAMVIMGFRMGIRASDIVNLKISDFDLKKNKVSFVQQKTNKAITLTIPTDVGNSIYNYIMQGRPVSGTDGDGYIFVRHNSPYSSLDRCVCRSALARILSESGFSLPRGQGFHITRRTFATRLLRARVKVDSLVDALGHSSRNTIDDYLAHDEEGMLLCPLPFAFAIGGAAQ